ncbi:permease [Solwaraspora sp. WMMD1047]|uniref:SCO7613 C-terminal domain-containing membrane protein n=1 Tax=Solwaraspora sp. WMMD1047 TaxID=3016102 RepID=UPI002416766F|nr:permease [Solwaraspora sp. WMMD1047]MDG4828674.1 permease [Solwaraspora sp. WMMD1047]
MSTTKCSSCGRTMSAGPRCPRCGAEQTDWQDDLARIERSIAEMKARDVAIAKEQKQIAAKMQAALFQRDILAHANEQRRKQATKPRRVLRRRAGQRPPTAGAPGATTPGAPPGTAPPRVPRQGKTGGPDHPPAPPPGDPGNGTTGPDRPRRSDEARRPAGTDQPEWRADDDWQPDEEWQPDRDWQPDESWRQPPGPAAHPPEASSREVQNILLGLGALLLGVAAVVFAAVAISSLGDLGRVSILVAATALMLAGAPVVARRGLTSTAETVAAVGLLLVPLTGYAVWTVDRVWSSGLSGAVFGGIICLITVGVAIAYAGATGLNAPRYAAVLAAQPVVPLLAYDWISGATGWTVVLAVVAALDLFLGWQLAQGRLTPPAPLVPPAPAPPDRAGATGRRFPGFRGPAAGADHAVDLDLDAPATGRDHRADPDPDRHPDPDRRAGRDRRPDGVDPDGAERPETAPEEADAVVTVEPGRPDPVGVAAPAPTPWLRELIVLLHGITVLAALGFAVVALLAAATVPAAAGAGLAMLLAAAVGLAGALAVRTPPLPDIAAGVFTLAVIGAAGRVAAVALPGRALLLIAAVIALAGLGVRAVPEAARRGPQLASAAALVVIGIVVSGGALRAAFAPVRAALPVWHADLVDHQATLAAAVGPAAWQLAATTFLLTIAAVLSLPAEMRREFAVAGAALTALALPASFGLDWRVAPWPPVLAAIGIAAVGLTARTRRAALAHAIGAALVGLAGAGASAARPGLNAAVLTALAAAGVLIALAPRLLPSLPADPTIPDWAAGGAAFALPGAVAAFVASALPFDPTPTANSIREATEPVLAAAFLAVCVTVCYAALLQVSKRHISPPLAVGTGLGALAVTAAAFGAPGATFTDVWVAAMLLVAAALLFLAPSIDAGRRADRLLDGSDFAAAAATAALVATLARIATILVPGAEIAAAAFLIMVVAVGIRTMPADWRRGPILGAAVSGAVVAVIAGWTALSGGLRVLATPGRIWAADLNSWPAGPAEGAWQAPVALVLLAIAAAIVLPRPWGYDVAAVCVGLATIGTPAALGLPWWSPIVVGGAVATGYGVASVAAADPRAGLARATVAAAVALHAVGASLVRPWTTAAALAVVTLVGVVVAGLARVLTNLGAVPTVGVTTAAEPAGEPDWAPPAATGPEPTPLPPHLAQIGGAATGGALLALPGALAAFAAELGWPAEVVLGSALAGASLGVALLAVARRQVPQYLAYGTVGVVGGATGTALAALPTGLPWGVYAAAAALLGVLAELIRSATPPPGVRGPAIRRWPTMLGGVRRMPESPPGGRWAVNPAVGAMAAAALPTVLAVAAVAPALVAALVDPYRTLGRIWQGPPAALIEPPAETVSGSNVLTALLLTVAAALAATGFSGGRPARAVPVVLPGAAITLLIAPTSLGLGWPTSTMAALSVFTLAMLGLALTPPPPAVERARSLRTARVLVFAIGLAAGGAGLAGSLATRPLTLFTLGGAVGVGAVAALAGRSQAARILGWLFASIMAQLLVLTTGLVVGLAPVWSAFGVLAVGAVLLLGSATLPRLRHPEAGREAATVEWSGYAAALIAAALAYDSPRHIAALLAAWGAVLGVAATRRGRGPVERRTMFWLAVACEISAWWLLMRVADVALPEAYTLPFAALALLVGVLELRHRPDLSSWVAYGPALVAALLPTLVIVVLGDGGNVRQVLLLLGGVATLIVGSNWQQQAPVIIGSVVTVIATLTLLTAFGPWLVLIPVGLVLLLLGASNESRRRTQEWNRAVRSMR